MLNQELFSLSPMCGLWCKLKYLPMCILFPFILTCLQVRTLLYDYLTDEEQSSVTGRNPITSINEVLRDGRFTRDKLKVPLFYTSPISLLTINYVGRQFFDLPILTSKRQQKFLESMRMNSCVLFERLCLDLFKVLQKTLCTPHFPRLSLMIIPLELAYIIDYSLNPIRFMSACCSSPH